jgi:hypothetical protein
MADRRTWETTKRNLLKKGFLPLSSPEQNNSTLPPVFFYPDPIQSFYQKPFSFIKGGRYAISG